MTRVLKFFFPHLLSGRTYIGTVGAKVLIQVKNPRVLVMEIIITRKMISRAVLLVTLGETL